MLDQVGTVKQKFIMTDRTACTQNRDVFLEQKIKGVMGSTWDATHMTSYLNRSFYSNKKSLEKEQNTQKRAYSMRRKKQGDFFFKNLRNDQNKSHIGYTKVNPLVSGIQISMQRQKALTDYFISRTQSIKQDQKSRSPKLMCEQHSKFKYEGNAIKFKATDPLTSRFQEQKPDKMGYQIQRMKRQITSRHPHGIAGIDHPQNVETSFYEKPVQRENRIRLDPISRTSFQLDRQWKSKKRVTPVSEQYRFRHNECIRKFRNENSHGYNILTNRQADE